MKVRVQQLNPEFWDQLVHNCEYATFFHTRCWTEIITKSFPFLENATIALEFENGRKAILPRYHLNSPVITPARSSRTIIQVSL